MPPKPGTCVVCGKTCSQSQHFKTHMLTHTNERPFKCSICGTTHRTKGSLDDHIRYVHGPETRPKGERKECIMCAKMIAHNGLYRHLRIHIKERPHPCSICGKEFFENKDVISHINSHKNVKGVPCVFCEKSFSIRANPENHLRSHIKERPFFCKRCPSSFSQQTNLISHVNSAHLKKRPFSCEICGKSYVRDKTREAHIRSHLNEKPYQCTECGKRFGTHLGIRGHMKLHIEEQRVTFPCKKCDKTYANISNLKRHERENHRLFPCIFCENEVSKTSMMKHLRSHINEKPYSCISCGDSFRNTNERAAHMKIHAKVRSVPVSCVFCEKVFPTKARLEIHIFSHINEKLYDCTKCPMSFSLSGELTRHNRQVHERLRPFPCEICGKAFANRPKLQRHTSTHLNEKPFKCNVCGTRFRSSVGLENHVKRDH